MVRFDVTDLVLLDESISSRWKIFLISGVRETYDVMKTIETR